MFRTRGLVITYKSHYMRKIFLILAITVYAYALTDEYILKESDSGTMEKPDVFPEWVKWNKDLQKAYEKGEVVMNDDSTAIGYPTEHPIDKDNAITIKL